MRIYLAGPMTRQENWNYEAFHNAAKMLRSRGHIVFNPAESDGDALTHHSTDNGTDFKTGAVTDKASFLRFLRKAFAADMKFICEEAEAIALLPGWESSGGARAEWAVAHVLRLEFIYL